MSDLKPCPFCGNAPAREKDGEYHVICCSGCRAEVSSTSKRELDALWDRRAAALEGEPGELERLREAHKAAVEIAETIYHNPAGSLWNHGTTPTAKDRAEWKGAKGTALEILQYLDPERARAALAEGGGE